METVLQGVVFSLESSRLFLRNANDLYRNGQSAAACILGTIAGELLGRSQWLWSQLSRIRSGEVLDCKLFMREGDHAKKLKDGLLCINATVPIQPLTKELFRRVRKAAPSGYQRLREEAQYVDLSKDGKNWNRPSAVDSAKIHNMLLSCGVKTRLE
jgi:AbiV family abortive infection protein